LNAKILIGDGVNVGGCGEMMMIGQVQVSNMSSKKAEQAAVEEKFEEEDEGA